VRGSNEFRRRRKLLPLTLTLSPFALKKRDGERGHARRSPTALRHSSTEYGGAVVPSGVRGSCAVQTIDYTA